MVGGVGQCVQGEHIPFSAHTLPPAATSITPPAHIRVSELKLLTAADRPGDVGRCRRRRYRHRCSEPLHLFRSLQRLIRHPESDADGIRKKTKQRRSSESYCNAAFCAVSQHNRRLPHTHLL